MSLKLKIGLDAVPLNRLKSGIAYYIFYLLDELLQLHPEWDFFLYTFSQQGDISHFTKYPNVTLRVLPFLSLSHSLWCQTTLSYGLYRDNISIFLGSTQSIPLLARKRLKKMLIIYDFAFKLFPHTLSPLKCQYLKTFTSTMVKRADKILCISHGTAAKLSQFYAKGADLVLIPPLKSSIRVHSPEESAPILAHFHLEYKKYVLTVGTLEPRKNFSSLITHYLHLLHTGKNPFPLVIVGGGGWRNKQLVQMLCSAQSQFPDKIRFLGQLDDAMLSQLLSAARYYLCFSLYEGYGMPLAEARCAGTPVICFDQPEMREAAEEDGLFLSQEHWQEELTFHLCSHTHLSVGPCHYSCNRKKALALSQAILQLSHA